MEEIKIKRAKEIIYKETLDNGLQIFVFRRKQATSFTEQLIFNVGGKDINFIDNLGNKVNVPMGTHHYLEHVLCELEDLSSTLTFYSRYGANSNAFTSLSNTAFIFDGTTNFREMALFQLDSIFNKKFNDEMIEHERGPISEEARTSMSNNYREGYRKYINHALDSKIYSSVLTGTLDEVKSITRNDIELVYNNFYKPNNAYVIVTTNEEPEKIINVYKEFFSNNKYNSLNAKKESYNHNLVFRNEIEKVDLGFEMPIANVSFKLDFDLNKEFKKWNYVGLLLDCNFGQVSTFRDELLYKKKVASDLGFGFRVYDNVLLVTIDAKTDNPEEFYKLVINKLNKLDFNEEDIIRKYKVFSSNFLVNFDYPESVSNKIFFNMATYNNIDHIEDYLDYDINDIKKVKEEIEKSSKGIFIEY